MRPRKVLGAFLLGFVLGVFLNWHRFSPPTIEYKYQHVRRPKGERVLCWILSLTVTPYDKLKVYTSWGQRCDKLVFVVASGEPSYEVFVHNYRKKDRHDLWNQAHRGWALITRHFLERYDWFIKLDTDSYFIPENFIFWTYKRNWKPEDPVYFGHTVFEQSRSTSSHRAQFNLGAGYGVSRALLRAVYPYLPTAKSDIPMEKRAGQESRWGEDYKFADALRLVYPNLLPKQTRDDWDRETFNPFRPEFAFKGHKIPWYIRGKRPELLEKQKGSQCCSSRPVLWHKFPFRHDFFYMDYLTYGLHVDPIPPEPRRSAT